MTARAVLHFLNRGPVREIAAAPVFSLVNSVAGCGGQIGVWPGRTNTSETWLIRLTASLVLFVSVRLLWRATGL